MILFSIEKVTIHINNVAQLKNNAVIFSSAGDASERINNGNIGLMYENSTDMDFIKFNPAYLKWVKEGELPTPALSSIDILEDDESFTSGNMIQVEAEFDDYVMLSGNRSLKGSINGETFTLSLADANREGTTFTFERELPSLELKEHE